MLEKIVYTLKDLRNSVAHNNTVFDTRFKTGAVNNRISKYIMAELSISNVTFNTIVDYSFDCIRYVIAQMSENANTAVHSSV